MPTNLGTAYIPIEGDWKRFNRDLSARGDGLTRKFAHIGTGLGKAVAGGAVAAAGVGFAAIAVEGKRAFDAFQESNKIAHQTNAVLKSTGGVAGVTANQIATLATVISRKSGVDDEAIQSGENLLLTFTNVRNEAGKGNKVFDRATRVITDMSVALGQDTKSSAIQVGKALNDPIKGVTALQRVGVSFTKQQKDQIKALVDGGKAADAQKLILRELTKEFGGSAAAQATAVDKMKVAVGNIEEAVGRGLAPAVDTVATKITNLAQEAEPKILGVSNDIAKIFNRKDLDLAGKITLSSGKVRTALKPLIDEGSASIGKMHLGDRLQAALTAAAPKIADSLAAAAPRAAGRFIHAFLDAGPWGRLLVAGFLLKKMGGLGAFAKIGTRAGATMGASMATATAGSGGWKGAASRIGRSVGGPAAIAAAIAFGPEFIKKVRTDLSSTTIGADVKFKLPKTQFAPGVGFFKPLRDAQRGLSHIFSPAEQSMRDFGETAEKAFNRLNGQNTERARDQLTKLADRARGYARQFPVFGKGFGKFADAAEAAAERATAALSRQWAGQIAGNFRNLTRSGRTNMAAIRTTVQTNAQIIRDRLGKDTEAGRKAAARNFRLAAKVIDAQMHAGVISTRDGTKQMRAYLAKALKALGLTQARADALQKTGTLLNSDDRPGRSTILHPVKSTKTTERARKRTRARKSSDDDKPKRDKPAKAKPAKAKAKPDKPKREKAKAKPAARRARTDRLVRGGNIDTLHVRRLIVERGDVTAAKRGRGDHSPAAASDEKRAADRARAKARKQHDDQVKKAKAKTKVHLSTLDPLAQFDDVDLTNARQFGREIRRTELRPLYKKPKPEKPISDGGSPAVGRMHGPVTVHQTFNVTGVHDDTHLRARLGREAEKRVRRALTVELERRGG